MIYLPLSLIKVFLRINRRLIKQANEHVKLHHNTREHLAAMMKKLLEKKPAEEKTAFLTAAQTIDWDSFSRTPSTPSATVAAALAIAPSTGAAAGSSSSAGTLATTLPTQEEEFAYRIYTWFKIQQPDLLVDIDVDKKTTFLRQALELTGFLPPVAIAVDGTSITKPSGSFWNRYQTAGIDQLLSLRLSGVNSIVCSTIMLHEASLPHISMNIPTDKSIIVIPIAYTAVSRLTQAVGLIINRDGSNCYKVTYIDSENNPMPEGLALFILRSLPSGSSISFALRQAKEQSYNNNCGPELIENIAQELTGFRVPETLVSEFHSLLLEGYLLGNANVTAPTSLSAYTSANTDSSSSKIPVLKLKPIETPEFIIARESKLDPFYASFINLLSSIAKVPAVFLDAWHWGGKLMSQIQNIVEETLPELQTDEQAARLSFLFDLLDHIRSSDQFMPFPRFPHKPDDPDDWGGGGGDGDDKKPQDNFGFGGMFSSGSDNGYNLTNSVNFTNATNEILIGNYNGSYEQ